MLNVVNVEEVGRADLMTFIYKLLYTGHTGSYDFALPGTKGLEQVHGMTELERWLDKQRAAGAECGSKFSFRPTTENGKCFMVREAKTPVCIATFYVAENLLKEKSGLIEFTSVMPSASAEYTSDMFAELLNKFRQVFPVVKSITICVPENDDYSKGAIAVGAKLTGARPFHAKCAMYTVDVRNVSNLCFNHA